MEQNAQNSHAKGAQPYLHEVQYYETDGMRIVHHSNYSAAGGLEKRWHGL